MNLIMILFTLNVSFGECSKKIRVIEYNQSALPSLLNMKKNKYDFEEKIISIKCEIYKEINEGDILVSQDPSFNFRGFFAAPIEDKKYKVLDKNP